jgi:hypothetical protein
MEREYLERNAVGLARLRALVGRLSEDELARPVEGDWTVAALLAHLAFWDRFVLARWRAAQEGHSPPAGLADGLVDLINAAGLEEWQAIPPHAAARQALAAAEASERLIAGLPEDVAGPVVASGRMSLLDRTLHWSGHLDQIEAAVFRGSKAGPQEE